MMKENTRNSSFSERYADWRNRKLKPQRFGRKPELNDISQLPVEECLNCGCSFQGVYCPQCGQSNKTKRFNFRSALANFFDSLFGSDNLFFSTCLNLLYRPGYVARDYIVGKRTRYMRPVSLLLLLVTINLLLSFFFSNYYKGIPIVDFSGLNEMEGVDAAKLQNATHIISTFFANQTVAAFWMAVLGMFTYKIVFRRSSVQWPNGEKRSLNTAECFFALVFFSSLTLLVMMAWMPLLAIIGASTTVKKIVIQGCDVLLATWVFHQLYEMRWIKSLILNIIAYLLVYVLFGLVITLYYMIFVDPRIVLL